MESIQLLLENAQNASRSIKILTDDKKKVILKRLAGKIGESESAIIAENQKDLALMSDSDPKKDRLLLTAERISDLAASVVSISQLQDPTNQIQSEKTMANGLFIQKKTVPLGVVGMIYESRPNVTIDVAALCLRSGNACVLRGGTDAFFTNTYLVAMIQSVLKEFNLDVNSVQLIPTDRKFIAEMLSAVKYIDIIIPRGSQSLIDYVRENSMVPVIETGAGVCHTYVEKSADLDMARNIVINAKVSRPSVCNALDTIIMDKSIAEGLIERLIPDLKFYKIDVFADRVAYPIFKKHEYPFLFEATLDDFGREFLDFKCSVKVVEGIEEALEHIRLFSSKHSEAIVSADKSSCERFMNEVDAAAVYTNASTRFTDGGVFGLGAEIGISTQKLHARGPFALEKLVTEKWFILGNGQIR